MAGVGTRNWTMRVPRPVWEALVGSGELAKLVNDRVKLEMATLGYKKVRIGGRHFWFHQDDIEKA